MSDRREFSIVRCAYCNRDKPHPDAFPASYYAQCWDCCWQEHLRSAHKRWWKSKIIRPARKAARERYVREETDRRIAEAPTELLARTVSPLPPEDAS